MKPLENKIALVTGASRGIGAQIALTLAALGASVVVNYVRNAEAAQKIVSEIEAQGGRALAVQADVSDLEVGRRLIAEVEARLGGLDILVNNAGTVTTALLDEATPEQFETQFGLNVRGLFFVTQAASKVMRDGGRIVVAAGKFP